RSVRAGGAVVVESGAAATIRAETPTEIVHVGPSSAAPPVNGMFGPADPDGHGVHVFAPEDANLLEFGVLRHTSFADGTCPTCRIRFFRDGAAAAATTGSHVHSQDEIIHVLSGALQVGRDTIGAGMSVAIP